MPVLDWIGKKAVVNHHQHVPYRLVHCNGDLSAGDPDSGSLLVQGDNLEALKALLPYYAGKVKLIYIDPPYNTGNEGWVYNDNVNSPQIQKWLGETVGKEAEDLSRHDKWLCMMYPRLRLLREFLREDGAIFISIDDNEVHHLRALMDEMFGRKNYLSDIVWKSRQFNDSRALSGISKDHEFLLVYGKDASQVCFAGLERDTSKFTNPDNDDRGPWMSRSILGLADAEQRPNLHYFITDPKTTWRFSPPPATGWRYGQSTMSEKINNGLIIFPKKEDGRPREKIFAATLAGKTLNFPSVIDDIFTADGTREIKNIFGEGVFAFPKPSSLVSRVVQQLAEPGDLVMDSFAGSGTTGHAVLQANKQDSGNRRFILVEMEEDICRKVTAERLTRVINGYDKANGKKEHVEGLGGGFRFCTLGKPLFDEYGGIDPAVKITSLAAHVFFMETGSPIPKRANGKTSLLGSFEGRAIYLLFSSDSAGFAQEGVGNVLTPDMLSNLPLPAPDFEGTKIIYGEGCTLDDSRLERENIVFKQIPYSIGG